MDESGFHYAMFIYRGGALLLLTTPQPLDEGRCRALLLSKLEALRLPPEACRVGFSRTVATRRQLDACVSQALQANRNNLSKQIGMLKGQAKKNPDQAAECEAKIQAITDQVNAEAEERNRRNRARRARTADDDVA